MIFRVGDKVSILLENDFGRPDLVLGEIYSGVTQTILNEGRILVAIEGKFPTISSGRGKLLIANNAVNKMLYPELKEFNEKWLSYES